MPAVLLLPPCLDIALRYYRVLPVTLLRFWTRVAYAALRRRGTYTFPPPVRLRCATAPGPPDGVPTALPNTQCVPQFLVRFGNAYLPLPPPTYHFTTCPWPHLPLSLDTDLRFGRRAAARVVLGGITVERLPGIPLCTNMPVVSNTVIACALFKRHRYPAQPLVLDFTPLRLTPHGPALGRVRPRHFIPPTRRCYVHYQAFRLRQFPAAYALAGFARLPPRKGAGRVTVAPALDQLTCIWCSNISRYYYCPLFTKHSAVLAANMRSYLVRSRASVDMLTAVSIVAARLLQPLFCYAHALSLPVGSKPVYALWGAGIARAGALRARYPHTPALF